MKTKLFTTILFTICIHNASSAIACSYGSSSFITKNISGSQCLSRSKTVANSYNLRVFGNNNRGISGETQDGKTMIDMTCLERHGVVSITVNVVSGSYTPTQAYTLATEIKNYIVNGN